jgi:ketosteroid isomerase-like protein
MSEENVEVVRAIYDAVGRRDAASVFALYDPDVEVDGSRLPEAQLTGWTFMRGHDDLRAFYRECTRHGRTPRTTEELIDAGEHVIVWFTSSEEPREAAELLE